MAEPNASCTFRFNRDLFCISPGFCCASHIFTVVLPPVRVWDRGCATLEQESCRGRRTVDVFALGVALYEMLTGKRAFEGKSQLRIMTAILENDPERSSVAAEP